MQPTETDKGLVGVRQIAFDQYPSLPPFDPDRRYAEYGFGEISKVNPVYDAVRNVLHDLRLDEEHRDTKDWNPFKEMIQPGDRVVIKPNLVLDAADQDAVTTHASVIRPVVDYAWKALQGQGEIMICDAPQVDADFDKIVLTNGLARMVAILNDRGCRVVLADIRARKTSKINDVVVAETLDAEKDKDAVVVDLKELSFFAANGVKQNRLSYGAYRGDAMRGHHQQGKHLYKVSKTVLAADVVISIPKLKTHKKAGITCCLKNLVGINVDKNYLPHFTSGPANLGGDEFPPIALWRFPVLFVFKAARLVLLGHWQRHTARVISACAGILSKFNFNIDKESPAGKADTAQRVYQLVTGTDYGGSWSGNETIWRMILDLNRIFLFADGSGDILPTQQRKAFYVVDGFVSGVKNGPLTPHVIRPGIVAAGSNAARVDQAILELTGVDAEKIPLYREAFSTGNGWLGGNSVLRAKLNGQPVDPSRTKPLALMLEPKHWHFARAGIQS
jgi:uncharacterized protein (DUF362 family)